MNQNQIQLMKCIWLNQINFPLYNISIGIYAQATWMYVKQVIEIVVFL